MATVAISGKNGSVSGQTGGAEVKSFDATITGEALEATSFASSGYREYVIGLTGGEGSFTAIGSDPSLGAVSSLVLQVGSTAGDAKISGPAIIESVTYTTEVDGLVEYGATFKFNGTITIGSVA